LSRKPAARRAIGSIGARRARPPVLTTLANEMRMFTGAGPRLRAKQTLSQ